MLDPAVQVFFFIYILFYLCFQTFGNVCSVMQSTDVCFLSMSNILLWVIGVSVS